MSDETVPSETEPNRQTSPTVPSETEPTWQSSQLDAALSETEKSKIEIHRWLVRGLSEQFKSGSQPTSTPVATYPPGLFDITQENSNTELFQPSLRSSSSMNSPERRTRFSRGPEMRREGLPTTSSSSQNGVDVWHPPAWNAVQQINYPMSSGLPTTSSSQNSVGLSRPPVWNAVRQVNYPMSSEIPSLSASSSIGNSLHYHPYVSHNSSHHRYPRFPISNSGIKNLPNLPTSSSTPKATSSKVESSSRSRDSSQIEKEYDMTPGNERRDSFSTLRLYFSHPDYEDLGPPNTRLNHFSSLQPPLQLPNSSPPRHQEQIYHYTSPNELFFGGPNRPSRPARRRTHFEEIRHYNRARFKRGEIPGEYVIDAMIQEDREIKEPKVITLAQMTQLGVLKTLFCTITRKVPERIQRQKKWCAPVIESKFMGPSRFKRICDSYNYALDDFKKYTEGLPKIKANLQFELLGNEVFKHLMPK